MGQLGICPDQPGLVAGYNMVPRTDGTIEDLSGNGNHGTINGPVFEFSEIGPGMKFDGVDDIVDVPDDPSLDITDDLTLSCWVNTTDVDGVLIGKWVVAGDQQGFSLSIVGGNTGLYISSDGAVAEVQNSGISVDVGSTIHICAVYKRASNSVDFYHNNVLVATKIFTVATNGIYNSNSSMKFGFTGATGGYYKGIMSQPKIITRALTESEIEAEYNAGAKAVNFKTDYGVTETVSADTSGELSNSPFRVESGSFHISNDTINGCSAKVIECVTAGVVHVPSAYFFGGDTQAAYGTCEWWMKKTGINEPNFVFIGSKTSLTDPGFNGYVYQFRTNNQIRLLRYNSGAVSSALQFTSPGYINADTWYACKVTRSSKGEFTTYLNDELIVVDGVSNPITDNTHTESKYLVLDLDAGDKVAYATKNGDCSIVKYQGVI
jgi:hypothetical protein